MLKIMKLETKRLLLRPIKKADAKSIVENINNINISKWLLLVPFPYRLKDAFFWIKNSQKEEKQKRRKNYTFGIELKEEHKLIGGMGIHKIEKYQETAEIGYWIGSKYHNKGYGSEALKAVIKFGFKKLRLRRLEAEVFQGNPSSGKLLQKFGFKQEGFKLKAKRSKADGKLKNAYFYGLLKENYKEQ